MPEFIRGSIFIINVWTIFYFLLLLKEKNSQKLILEQNLIREEEHLLNLEKTFTEFKKSVCRISTLRRILEDKCINNETR